MYSSSYVTSVAVSHIHVCATTGGSEREVGGRDSGVRNTYISFVSEVLSNIIILVHWSGLRLAG